MIKRTHAVYEVDEQDGVQVLELSDGTISITVTSLEGDLAVRFRPDCVRHQQVARDFAATMRPVPRIDVHRDGDAESGSCGDGP